MRKSVKYALIECVTVNVNIIGEVEFRIKRSKNQKITKCPTKSKSNFFNILNGTFVDVKCPT